MVPELASDSPSKLALRPFDTSPHSGALPYFLAQKDVSGSARSVSASALESAVSPRSPGFFEWKVIFRVKDQGAVCSCIASGCRCSQAVSVGRGRKHTHAYTRVLHTSVRSCLCT